MDDFDLTQPMSLCFEEEDDDDRVVETTEVTILKIPLQNDIPKELEFSLHNGMNRIGRSESCEVCIKNKVLSKEHAVIEVGGDCFLIYDLNSSNKTWKGKKPLKPNVKYKLEPRDEITFGHIKAQFLVKEEGNEAGDSGSETGSESMLLLNEEYCAFSVSTPIKNTEANEVGTNIVENASTSKATFPQKPSTAEEEKTESLKEAAVDLENAATEQFDGIDFCDSDAETDCEDHSEEKTITKEKETSHSENVTGPQREEGTLNPTSNVTGSIKILNCDGESSIGSKNLADQAQAAGKIIDAQVSDNSFSKHQKLLRCHSLNVSSEELPPTQVNLNSLALESVANKEENIQHGKKILGSLDSLPETQPNTSIFYEDFEVPESPRHETDDDLPPTQCVSSHIKNNIDDDLPPTQCVSSHVKNNIDDDLPPTQCVSSHVKHNIDDNLPPAQCASSHVKNNIGNINSSVLKDRIVVLELPGKSESKDDLPPTQVNLALQFSEEQNFLQRDDSQSSYDNNTSSPKPSTSSGINCSRSVIPQCRDIHKKLVGSGGKGFEETSSVAGKSGRTLLSCINISVEEGSPSGGSSILCPSTQRRSDGCDYKIKNTDIHCSPTLPRVSGGNVSDSVAETPPHLLKESIMDGDFSSTVTSLSARLSEVSPIALQNSASTSNSTSKTSGDHCTPDTHGKLQPKASTPDSARAGELNYSGNYSPKVYKTKLNDMDKSTQEILHVEQNDREVVSSNMPKSLSKKSKHPQNHIDKVIPESKARLDHASGNRLDKEDDIGSGKRQSRTNRKGKATRKTDNGNTSITKNTGPKKLSPESNAPLKTKQSTTGEPDNLNNVPQKRRSKRGIDTSAKYAVSDISKEPHFESNDNNESEQQNPTAKPHTEKSDLEDSSVCLTNANDFKSSSSRRLARKKKPANDQSIQPLSSKRSKRQKCVPSEESNENGDICGGDITSDVTKEISEMDSKNDCATTPPRKSTRRKQLHFEQDSNISDTNQETDFSVFRKNEAREIEKESLVDTRQSKRRKVNPVKDVCENVSLVQVQSNKYNELSLNETEISISNSGEHSNIVAQEGRSDANKIQKSEGNCHGPAVQQKAKGKTDKNEMQHDSDDKTMKNNEKLVRTEESPLRGKRNRLQRKSPQLRQSRRRETQDTTSTDKPLSLDTSSKIENEDGMLNKLNFDKRQASRSKQSHKEEVMHHSNTNTEDASLLSMESSRSLKLQLSASETSTDENLEVSEKCQISVFDSVVSLIKLDTQKLGLNKFKNSESRAPRKSKISKVEEDASKKEDSSDVSVQGVRKGRQSRTKFNLKEKDNVPEEEDISDISVQGVKKGRLSRTKFSLKEKEEDVSRKEDNNDVSVQGVKRGRQSRAKFNLKEEEDIVSEKEDNCDISVQGVKKGRRSRAKFNLKEKEEDACKKEGNSDVSVQEARKGRQSRTKFNLKEKEDNVSGEGDNSDISVQGVKKGRQSRAKFNLKEKEEDVSEKEDNSDVSVRGVKRARQLRTKFNLKEKGDVPEKEDNNDVSVQGVKRGRQSRAKFNLKEEEDNVSEKEDNDVSVQGVKKGRQSRTKLNLKEKLEDVSKKEENGDVSFQEAKKGRRSCSKFNLKNKEEDVSKEEDNNDFPVQEAKKGRSKFNTKDNLSSSPSVKNKKHSQCLNSSSLSDSICENDVTPSKNKKAKTTQNATFTSPSSRSQQYPKPKVMFTMVEDEEPQKVVVNLGGRVVEDVNMCTHLVADKLRRTVKALCCIGKGIPLVNIKWIQECKKTESFVDHMPYLIKDKAAEKQYQFELQKTLQKAAEKPLLSSWSIHVTPKVVPSPDQMKDIIQCAGGKYLPKMPNRLSEKTVVVTCVADLNLCSHAIKCGIPVVGSEFILTGLFQYKIDTKLYSLSKK